MSVRVRVRVRACVCACVCMCVYYHLYIYIHIYIYIYAYIHIGTSGVLKGFRGTTLLIVSAKEGLRITDPVTYEALGTMRVLDAHAGGLLARELALRYTMNPAASARKVSHMYIYAFTYTHAYT